MLAVKGQDKCFCLRPRPPCRRRSAPRARSPGGGARSPARAGGGSARSGWPCTRGGRLQSREGRSGIGSGIPLDALTPRRYPARWQGVRVGTTNGKPFSSAFEPRVWSLVSASQPRKIPKTVASRRPGPGFKHPPPTASLPDSFLFSRFRASFCSRVLSSSCTVRCSSWALVRRSRWDCS